MAFSQTKKLVTIDRFIAEQEEHKPEANGEFTGLMHNLVFAMRVISHEVRRAGLNNILGLTKLRNSNGDVVSKLDEYANNIILNSMAQSGKLCCMASEESVGIIRIPEDCKKGNYILVFDPLDGSTNIDVNITIGTIFSLYKRVDESIDGDGTLEDVLQPGDKQVAAGYVLFGSSTVLVYTSGNGVNVFTYDPDIGEFLLTFENIKIPKRGKNYSCNEGNYYKWEDRAREYVNYLKTPTADHARPYNFRYIATAVADIHRTIFYGGIYLYPAGPASPNGKIRLVYEANPLAMIVEQAGGRATNGKERLLGIKPESIHQTVPFYIGSEEDVLEAELFLKGKHINQQI